MTMHPVPRMRRALAFVVDAAACTALTLALAPSTGMFFARRAVVTFHVGEPGSWWKGPIPMLLGATSPYAYGAAFAVLCILVMEGAFAVSPGKMLMRLQVFAPAPGATRKRWMRLAVKAAPAWFFCLALVLGWWPLAAAAAATAIVLGPASLVLVLCGRAAAHDRCAGTSIQRV